MSDLFEAQDEVTQDKCDAYAQKLVKSSVTSMPWQGFHSYTLRTNSGLIIQFRSAKSPLDSSTTKLAKDVHGHLAPATLYHGLMPNWIMEILAGVGYAFTASTITTAKLDITVTDFANIMEKPPISGKRHSLRLYHETQAIVPLSTPRFTKLLERTQKNMGQTLDLMPWVLTHQDLSNTNILVDPDSGHITGVVDWADATIEPFGMALWGLESVLGRRGQNGWSYYESDPSRLRASFWKTFLGEIEIKISDECRNAIHEIRTLGILLRYGFCWGNGLTVPVKDTTYLDVFLKDELELAEQSHGLQGSE